MTIEISQSKPKHRRRSRKSTLTQLSDMLFKISQELEKPDIKPARANLLISQLETLKYLQQREDAQKDAPTVTKLSSGPSVEEIENCLAKAKSEREKTELDANVAQMLARIRNGVSDAPRDGVSGSQPSVALSKPVPRPIPSIDSDLVI
jgi:hypothetical protein